MDGVVGVGDGARTGIRPVLVRCEDESLALVGLLERDAEANLLDPGVPGRLARLSRLDNSREGGSTRGIVGAVAPRRTSGARAT
jgi:hypothetical protein